MFFRTGKRQFLLGWRRVNGFYHHLRKGTKVSLAVLGVVFLLLVVYVAQSLWHRQKVSADLASFYPAKCLGGWQYVAHAENMPDLDESASVDDFNEINSAVLEGAMAQLYCSDFNGENPIGTVPQRLILRLSLAIKTQTVNVDTPVIEGDSQKIDEGQAEEKTGELKDDSQVIDQTNESQGQSAEVDLPAIDNPEPAAKDDSVDKESVQVTPVIEPVDPRPSVEPTSWLPSKWQKALVDLVARPVLAQEAQEIEKINEQQTTLETVIPEPIADNQQIDSEAPLVEPAPEEINEDLGTQESMVSTTLEVAPVETGSDQQPDEVVEPTIPADALLQVSYTLDGQSWKSLGWVREGSWRNVSFDLPLEGISDWSSLQWLQVRFDRVATLNDNQPVFYLDGMALEAEYDSVLEEVKVDDSIDQPNLKKDKLLKQKTLDDITVVNVVRKENGLQELWYRKNSNNQIAEAWKKIEIEGEEGYPEFLDLRSGIVFWVSHREDKEMLAAYNTKTGNVSMNDVIVGGLSSLYFDEYSDEVGLVTSALYYLDEGESYYFGK